MGEEEGALDKGQLPTAGEIQNTAMFMECLLLVPRNESVAFSVTKGTQERGISNSKIKANQKSMEI